MNRKLHSSESGQAAVLLVLAMIVLLGFAALAVDGSMVYSDRRFAQSGADAASLAGAGAAASVVDTQPLYKSTWSTNATCTSGNVAAAATVARNEAIVQAEANDLIIGDTTPAEQGFVTTECGDEDISSPGVDENGDACDTPSSTIYSAPYMDVKTVSHPHYRNLLCAFRLQRRVGQFGHRGDTHPATPAFCLWVCHCCAKSGSPLHYL